MNATLRRDGSVTRQAATEEQHTATTTPVHAHEQRAGYADPVGAVAAVSAGRGQLPTPEIVFKCVDAETTVVVGSTVEEREGRFIGGACPDEPSVSTVATTDKISMATNPDTSTEADATREEDRSPATSPIHEDEAKRAKRQKPTSSVDNDFEEDGHQSAGRARGAASMTAKSVAITISDSSNGGEVIVNHDQHLSSSTPNAPSGAPYQSSPPSSPTGVTAGSRPCTQALGGEEVRPQICVPIMGAGDSGCIGMVVVQGFTTGALVGDDTWRDWFMHRMEPLTRGENRNVKRLKLVRPRGLPEIGKLEHVPTGTAAKVVYGSVTKISRKRGMPVYAVR